MKGNNLKKNKNHGFTLMELIISISILVVMILSITEIFAKINDGQRNAIAAQNIQESMRYALEVIAKEIRMAKVDETGSCIGAGNLYLENNNTLKFINYHDECVTYYLDNDVLKVDRDSYIANASPTAIKISNLKFIVVDNSPAIQSRVTISMDVEAIGKDIDKQSMPIQTTISSRFY